ncbi:DegT/DnrJ/EryC1/StrS family aminotransferase [Pelovirga terrestris]|uniref:DegT/DnrJ/EryC1/StrS family aminotransferase n=1 Tax=Pelovirga terrestris TaxID=2771352 RepID=A0A8J6QTU4_9BACT|nr:DegT/DnrJ/EryC1/StrS family aminotransferase [Pelovirga terrestris]MBD1399620.1 DegT/DnrJ/EryC1/StrS family aminotransferase [Pelovirga terrestris]
MRIGRILPPAASPIGWTNLAFGLRGLTKGNKSRDDFAADLALHYHQRHCFLVSSGKAALTLILKALHQRYPGRDEVLIPAYTCYSVPSAIARAGLKVRLCDIAENSLDFDLSMIDQQTDNKKLLCVIPTHLFGLPADIAGVRSLITDPEVTIVEDAAQAMGGEVHGQQLGALGDVGFFSLGRGKALSTVEGGVILTNDDELAALIRREYETLPEYQLTQHIKLILYAIAINLLMHPWMFWLPKSLPFLKLGETIYDTGFSSKKLTAFQAGLGRHWRNTLAKSKQIRSTHVGDWQTIVTGSLTAKTDGPPQPLIRFPYLLDSPKAALSMLQQSDDAGLGVAISYPDAIHRIPQIADQFAGQDYPNAAAMAQRLVTMPVHRYLTENDMLSIASILR